MDPPPQREPAVVSCLSESLPVEEREFSISSPCDVFLTFSTPARNKVGRLDLSVCLFVVVFVICCITSHSHTHTGTGVSSSAIVVVLVSLCLRSFSHGFGERL